MEPQTLLYLEVSVLEKTAGRKREGGVLVKSDETGDMSPLWLAVLFTGVSTSRCCGHERITE